MKKIVFIFIVFLSHCSFDNKTGIWENSTETVKKMTSLKILKIYIQEKNYLMKLLIQQKILN